MFYTQSHNVIGIFIIFVIFHPSREIFTSYWTVTIAYEGLQIQTYDLHSRPMRNEGYNYLAFHTFCNTGHLLFRLSTRSCEFHDWRRAFDRGSFSTCFIWRLMSQTGFEHPTFCMRDESFTSYVIYYSLLNMDKIASLEESHNQGDVDCFTTDTGRRRGTNCNLSYAWVKRWQNFFFRRGRGADSKSCRRLGYWIPVATDVSRKVRQWQFLCQTWIDVQRYNMCMFLICSPCSV